MKDRKFIYGTLGETPPDYDPSKHNYFKKWMELAETFEGKVGLHEIHILHDDWCDLLTKKGIYCNCEPEVSLKKGGGK